MDTCGHVGWQIKNTNTKETANPNRKGRNADQPDMRFAIQQRNKAKSERGRGQQKQPQPRFAKDTVTKSHCVATHKNALNELVAAQRVKHASKLLLLTDNKSISCTPLHSSLSESSHKFLLRCSVQDELRLPCTERWVQEQEE